MLYCVLLFWLLFGHCLADYPLQGYLSVMKRRKSVEGREGRWVLGLASHGCIHAGFVFYFTGLWTLGLVEWCSHMAIDFMKCEGYIGMKTDQALHVAFKVGYVLFIYWSVQ